MATQDEGKGIPPFTPPAGTTPQATDDDTGAEAFNATPPNDKEEDHGNEK